MANAIYTSFKEYCADNTIDMDGDSFKVALLDATHTFTATNSTWTDVSANEISGTGYSAGGAALVTPTWGADGTTIKFDGVDTAWTGASFTANYAVIYSDTPTNPADPLVCHFDFGGAQTVTAGTFTISWAATGILRAS